MTARVPAKSFLSRSESRRLPASDLGGALGKSSKKLGVGVQARNPIVHDVRSRGKHLGQLLASGSYWVPARLDLDTMLSKIDPRIVEHTVVIKGPYSARYGPGFDFIDFQLQRAPLFSDGPQSGGSSSIEYQTNGERWYGRQNVWAGTENLGVLFSYGHKVGNDYETGGGFTIPASYNSRDFEAALGWNPQPGHHIEVDYLRLDQTDVELAGQILDISHLKTDAGEITYTIENQDSFDLFSFETWYNRTAFDGDNLSSGKRQQIPLFDQLDLTYRTDVVSVSTGFDLNLTWGSADTRQTTLGLDLRHIHQRLDEFAMSPALANPGSNAPIPSSGLVNPGLYLEQLVQVRDNIVLRYGGRIDTIFTNADNTVAGTDFAALGLQDDLELLLGGEFEREFHTWALFMTAEQEVSPGVTFKGGVGHAMRPPQLTNLYASLPFLAVLQQGFSAVAGNPELEPERLIQLDLGFDVEKGPVRANVNGFYGWIHDYITYEAVGRNFIPFLDDALVARYTNTDLATLSGVEASVELDVLPWWTTFATMSFVEGRDHSRSGGGAANLFLLGNKVVPNLPRGFFAGVPGAREEPLAGINPLEVSLGHRFHAVGPAPDWSLEVSARVVDEQNRIATSLLENRSTGFATLNIRGHWNVTDNWLISGGVENALDKLYREHLDLRTGTGVFQPGINAYLSTEITY